MVNNISFFRSINLDFRVYHVQSLSVINLPQSPERKNRSKTNYITFGRQLISDIAVSNS